MFLMSVANFKRPLLQCIIQDKCLLGFADFNGCERCYRTINANNIYDPMTLMLLFSDEPYKSYPTFPSTGTSSFPESTYIYLKDLSQRILGQLRVSLAE
jgi:hypothetical protein